MFGFKKKKNSQVNKNKENYMNKSQNNYNKMDDEQKQQFLQAMGVNSSKNKDISEEKNENIFKTRAEKRAASDGYTRPVAPIPVQGEDVNRITKSTKTEQTTLKLNKFNPDITLDDLYNTLAEVQNYQSSDYTEETWLTFYNAFTKALIVYQMDQPKLEEILIVRDELIVSKNQLVKKK